MEQGIDSVSLNPDSVLDVVLPGREAQLISEQLTAEASSRFSAVPSADDRQGTFN